VDKVRQIFPTVKIVAGGPHASALPSEVAKNFDFVIVGESENVIAPLIDAIRQNADLPSVIYAQPVQDLDKLPFPAYHLVNVRRYTRRIGSSPCLSVLTTRGCLYDCAFCNSRVFTRGRQYFRFRSPESIAGEIAWLRDAYGITHIRFQDDLFTFSPERIEAIARLSPPITYRCFARADTLSEPMCETLVRTGCNHVAVGVESGSEVILRAMRKGLTPSTIRDGLKNAHRAGLRIRIYLMVGFPGESDATIDETIRFLDSVPFDEFVVYPTIPYPGTPLFNNPSSFGISWIDPDFSKYIQVGKDRQCGYVLATSAFGPDKVAEWRHRLIEHLESRGVTWYGESSLAFGFLS